MARASSEQKEKQVYSDRALIAIAAGVFVFAAVTLVISRLGVAATEAVIFALLCAVCCSIFVSRERSLNEAIDQLESGGRAQVAAVQARHDALYADSVVCCVEFDPATLEVHRASHEFYKLLQISVDGNLPGQHMEDILGVAAIELEGLVARIRENRMRPSEVLACKFSDGRTVSVEVSGVYLDELRLVELMLVPADREERQQASEQERVLGDMERVRRGMVQRENRILELKGEVNELLRQSQQPTRYKVDHLSDDTRSGLAEGKGKERVR